MRFFEKPRTRQEENVIENQLQKVKGIVEHFRQRTPGFPGDIVIRAPEVAALAAVVEEVERLRGEGRKQKEKP